MEKQVSGHNGIFPTILRELLEHHPKTGEKTTLRDLGKAVGTRQQTISLYKNGETQPTPETLARIARFFGVSVDYLLTGISSENKGFNEELGLSEEAVNMLKLAKSIPRETEDAPTVIGMVNDLLSDRDFYEFLEDAIHQVYLINHLDESNIPDNFDAEGYYIWSLQKHVEEFILRQMVKHGLKVEIR